MLNQKDIVREKHNSTANKGIRPPMQERSRCSTLRGLLQLIPCPCGRYRALHILPRFTQPLALLLLLSVFPFFGRRFVFLAASAADALPHAASPALLFLFGFFLLGSLGKLSFCSSIMRWCSSGCITLVSASLTWATPCLNFRRVLTYASRPTRTAYDLDMETRDMSTPDSCMECTKARKFLVGGR
jgi:hypothetical protein